MPQQAFLEAPADNLEGQAHLLEQDPSSIQAASLTTPELTTEDLIQDQSPMKQSHFAFEKGGGGT